MKTIRIHLFTFLIATIFSTANSYAAGDLGVEWSGDFRYRYDYLQSHTTRSRHQNRIKASAGLTAKPDESLSVGFFLITGSTDPISANQTLTGGFAKKQINIDLAYLNWQPLNASWASLSAGRIRNPFFTPGKSDLIWDHDLRFEGMALNAKNNWDMATVFWNLGGFAINEASGTTDTYLLAAQLGVDIDTCEHFNVKTGGSFYGYSNLAGRALLDYNSANNTYGNSARGGTLYQEDYRLAEGFLELGIKSLPFPASVNFDYVRNIAASNINTETTGVLSGFNLGKLKNPGNVAFAYNYRDLEQDAVVGAMTESDLNSGGTSSTGHKYMVSYQVSKPTKAGLAFLSGTNKYRRFQTDFTVSF